MLPTSINFNIQTPEQVIEEALRAWQEGKLQEAKEFSYKLLDTWGELWSLIPLLLLHCLCLERPCLFPVEGRVSLPNSLLYRACSVPQDSICKAEEVLHRLHPMQYAYVMHGMVAFIQGNLEAANQYHDLAGDALTSNFAKAMRNINSPETQQEGIQFLVLAAQRGHASAQIALAKLYMLGRDLPCNPEEAQRLYSLAAEQGVASAQRELALFYISGGNSNFATAAKLLHQAAEQGDASAQTSLGHLYLRGIGVDSNSEKAKRLFYAACNNEYADAFFWVGLMHLGGSASQKDSREAARLIRHANALGSTASTVYSAVRASGGAVTLWMP